MPGHAALPHCTNMCVGELRCVGFAGRGSAFSMAGNGKGVELEEFHDASAEAMDTGVDDRVMDTAASGQTLKAPAPMTALQAYMNLVKGNFGPGCLALPVAFARVGPVVGSCLLGFITFQGIYSMVLLVRLRQTLATLHVRSFEDVGGVAFGTRGRTFVQGLVVCQQLGVCCVFISLVATNLHAAHHGALSMAQATAVVYVMCLALSMLRNITSLSPLSVLANALMALACATVVGEASVAISSGERPDDGHAWPRGMSDVTLCLGALFYAYEGISLILPVENEYNHAPEVGPGPPGTVTSTDRPGPAEGAEPPAHRPRFSAILVTAMLSVSATFAAVGNSAGWAYPHVNSGSITAYLQMHHPDNWWLAVVNGGVGVAILLTYPLQLQPAVKVLEVAMAKRAASERPSWGARALMRASVTSGCLLVVLLLPRLDLLISLLGAMCQAVMAGTPYVLALNLGQMGLVQDSKARRALHAALAAFCASCALLGTASAVRDIVADLAAGRHGRQADASPDG